MSWHLVISPRYSFALLGREVGGEYVGRTVKGEEITNCAKHFSMRVDDRTDEILSCWGFSQDDQDHRAHDHADRLDRLFRRATRIERNSEK